MFYLLGPNGTPISICLFLQKFLLVMLYFIFFLKIPLYIFSEETLSSRKWQANFLIKSSRILKLRWKSPIPCLKRYSNCQHHSRFIIGKHTGINYLTCQYEKTVHFTMSIFNLKPLLV